MTPRTCTACGAPMRAGYQIENGSEYYCSDACLYTAFTPEAYANLYDEGEGDSFWTTWPDEDA